MWCNSASDYARALILVSNHMFLGMGNPLRYFSGASDQFEDQKQGGRGYNNWKTDKIRPFLYIN